MSQRPATKRRSIQGGTLDEQREHIRRPQAPAFMGDEPGFAAAADLGGTGILASERRPNLSGVGVATAPAWLESGMAQGARAISTFGLSARAMSARWSIGRVTSCGATSPRARGNIEY